ncbi:hypothetical protein TNIN_34991 [Trichonephila inaurata madagascariensis]|uniref:Uncharacterized protein n=1 Tax=Trichonephila inaurata madagascariensis TaxID=2747483 RepID=A0A8X6JWU9_9ARAC|nr:hypothetical protein TNIN_34991 [Trichonephila inaurata madagascariensis]
MIADTIQLLRSFIHSRTRCIVDVDTHREVIWFIEQINCSDVACWQCMEENPEPTVAEEQNEQKEIIQATKAQLEEERQREIKRMEKVSSEEIKRRQEYLRQQREKLVDLKKQEREKLLQRYEENSSSRPRSARAAQRAVQEDAANPAPEANVQAFRNSLAAMLKAEVIEREWIKCKEMGRQNRNASQQTNK